MKIKQLDLKKMIYSYVLLLSIIFVCTKSTEVSLGNLTILSHPQQSKINNSITLSPMAYQQHLPNLQMLKIRIVKADPYDACSPLNTAKIFPLQDNSAYLDTFVLVDGKLGDCKYWRKSQMAKQSMVKGIIIIDDNHDKNSNQAYDYNNGQFYSFLIKPQDAENLLVDDKQIQAKLKIYQQNASNQKKNIYLWLSSLNSQSYDYLNWWNQTITNLPELKQRINWQPKYVFYGNKHEQNKQVYSCGCNGIFCSPQFHGKTTDILIKEDLRQKLIFQKYPEQYLNYIQLFTERCLTNYLKEMFVEQCAKTQMTNAKINQTAINKQVENFLLDCQNKQNTKLFGKLLTDKGRFSMIGSYPVILLNRQILQFTNQNQLQAILCRKFSLQQSQGCIQYYHTTIQQVIVSIFFFLLILLGLFAVGFFVVMFYKNRLRKQMHKQVRMQVSTAVQHYFQLTQDMSNRKK